MRADVLVECARCGAPLDAEAGARTVRCAYCRATNEVLRARKLSGETPAGWKPPEVWTPPDAAAHASVPLRRRSATPVVALAAAVAVAVGVAGAVAAAVLSSAGGTTEVRVTTTAVGTPAQVRGLVPEEARRFLGGVVPGMWDGRSTLECAVNGSVTIDGRQGGVEGAPLVRATGPNCTVVLRGSTLSGDPIVEAGTNTKVLVEGSALSGPRIVQGGTNTEVEIRDSTLEATEIALDLGLNGKVRLTGETTVRGGETAIAGDTNLEVEARGDVRLEGGEDAVRCEQNGKLRMRGGVIEAGERAVALARNADVELRDTRVVGREAALAFELNADVRLRDVVTEGARRLGRNLDLDERP